MSAHEARADDCEHIVHEWPMAGPWIDYTCIKCGHNWRTTWEQAWRSMQTRETT